MAEIKTIKDIDDESWAEFKSLAARNKMKLGSFFRMLLGEYEKTSKFFWKDILYCEKILTDKEAEDMENIIKEVRKEYGFRS